MQVGRYLQLEAVADPVALPIITTSKATTHSIGSLSDALDCLAQPVMGGSFTCRWSATLTFPLFIRLSQNLRLRVKLSGQPPS